MQGGSDVMNAHFWKEMIHSCPYVHGTVSVGLLGQS